MPAFSGRSLLCVRCLALAALLIASTQPATAVEPIGEIVSLSGRVGLERQGQFATADLGAALAANDAVVTGEDGRVGIRFRDETQLNVGPRARVTMDSFVFDPAGKDPSFMITIARGSFSFVSGVSAKLKPDAVSLRTPVATIGIRGTYLAGRLDPRPSPYPLPLWASEDGQLPEAVRPAGDGLRGTFVLLPNPVNGAVGRIRVTTESDSREIAAARGAAAVSDRGGLTDLGQMTEGDVQRLFAAVLAPPPAKETVSVPFELESATLSGDAQALIARMADSARKRPATAIRVAGHSDLTASDRFNLDLSRRRAEVVGEALIAAGVEEQRIRIEHHGFRRPAIKTGSGVAEAQNRRVEITLE